MKKNILLFLIILLQAYNVSDTYACTNFIVTKGASKDGSVMIVYTCDGEFHPHLRITPAADYKSGEMLQIEDWSGNVLAGLYEIIFTKDTNYL